MQTLPRSHGKIFCFEETFDAWGTWVQGQKGWVGAPASKRREVARLAGISLFRLAFSKTLMERLHARQVSHFYLLACL